MSVFCSELIFSGRNFSAGGGCALDCGVSLQRRFALVPAGVSQSVTILDTFLCKFLTGVPAMYSWQKFKL